jgi:hypothetical protein
LTVVSKVAKGIVLGIVAVPDGAPDTAAQDRLDVAGHAFVAFVHAIDADTEDVELGTEGVRTGTREVQRSECAG